jgi:CheY-like chemotaxis protein
MSQNLQSVPFSIGAAVARSRTKPTILVAEDSDDGREMMYALLRLKGYEVIAAENGVQAIEAALTSLPDLIFLDFELPRLNGIAVARNIRRSAKLRNVPIIMLSGHDPASHRQVALEAGCSDYLMKPIDFARLDVILNQNVPLQN